MAICGINAMLEVVVPINDVERDPFFFFTFFLNEFYLNLVS